MRTKAVQIRLNELNIKLLKQLADKRSLQLSKYIALLLHNHLEDNHMFDVLPPPTIT